MKRNHIAVLALEERQWQWAVFQTGGHKPEKLWEGALPAPADGKPETLVAGRDALLAQWHERRVPCDGMRLILGIPATDALFRVLDLPTCEPDEVREMSVLQVEKISPFTAEETVISHEVLSTRENDSRVLAAALNLERVEEYGTAFREAGLKPERVDLNLCAYWQMIAAASAETSRDPGRLIHLLLRENACDVIITQAGNPVLFRELARRDALPEAEYVAEIAAQTSYSLAVCELEHGPAAGNKFVIRHAGNQPAQQIAAALQKAGLENAAELDDAEKLPNPCEGLAQRAADNRRILLNLAPPGWRLAEIKRIRRLRFLLTAGVAAAIWISAIGGLYGSLLLERRRLAETESLYAKLETKYNETLNSRKSAQNLLHYTDQSRSALETLREISAMQPPGIDLASFDYRKGMLIRLAGEAESASIIYEFKNRLDDSPLFAGTDPPSIARSGRNRRETFRLNINFPNGAGTAAP